jgi:hypothetical protein
MAFKAKNAGNRRASASVTRFHLSANRSLDKRDTRLGQARLPQLARSESFRARARLRIPSWTPPGLHYVIACADAGKRVREASERNNCRAPSGRIRVWAVALGAPPGGSSGGPAAPPVSPAPGGGVSAGAPPAPEICSDGQDNDGDAKTDFPTDPGCNSTTDTDETDPPPPPPAAACGDGLDSDSDSKVDYPADPGCVSSMDPDETDPPDPPGGPAAGMTLTWSDDFNGAAGSRPDPTNWAYQRGGFGWGHSELQCYTSLPGNSGHDGLGNMQIIARRETFVCGSTINEYTSARLETEGIRQFQYGYIEARIKVPPGQGIWPAFWTLGADVGSVGWPRSGEMDVFEVVGKEPTSAYQTIHGATSSGGHWQLGNRTLGPAWHEQFHTYGLKWSENRITFYIEGEATRTLTPTDLQSGWEWAFNKPHFLILNVAVGGIWPGNPDATTPFPATMLIDYVRVYQ